MSICVMALEALRAKYQSEIDTSLTNIKVYEKAPVGIGEHPDIVDAIDSQVKRYSEAKEMLDAVNDVIDSLKSFEGIAQID